MNRRNVMFTRSAFTGLLALTAACGGSNTGYGTRAQSGGTTAQSATLMVATDARLGSHLVDGSGRSLYYFAKDVPAGGTQAAVSNCNAGCLPVWPIFQTDSVVAQGINATDVGQITRSDGSKQTTYKGFPLYYYVGDTAAGDTNGEGVNGIWYVVHEPTYSIALLSKANEAACDSGNPYSAKDLMPRTISSWASPVMPFLVMPARRSFSISFIRSTERLNPIARRSSSACPPVNPAATMAIWISCS